MRTDSTRTRCADEEFDDIDPEPDVEPAVEPVALEPVADVPEPLVEPVLPVDP